MTFFPPLWKFDEEGIKKHEENDTSRHISLLFHFSSLLFHFFEISNKENKEEKNLRILINQSINQSLKFKQNLF